MSEVPVGPSIEMTANGRVVKERPRIRESQVRRKECLGQSTEETSRPSCSLYRYLFSLCIPGLKCVHLWKGEMGSGQGQKPAGGEDVEMSLYICRGRPWITIPPYLSGQLGPLSSPGLQRGTPDELTFSLESWEDVPHTLAPTLRHILTFRSSHRSP